MSETALTAAGAPAATSGGRLVDTQREVATPEGIELALRLAGPVPRALAWAIDFLLRVAVVLLIASGAAALGGVGTALLLVTWFVLEWLFPAWCEVHWDGATPGKKALGLRVVHDDGRPVRWPAALTRNLLRAVDFLPFFYGFGLVAMLMNRDFKRLGDLAAATVVVYRDAVAKPIRVAEAPPLAPRAPLAVSEQRVIVEFAERLPGLTAERADELAALVPSLGRPTGAARLVGIANHLLGRGRAQR